MQASTSLDYGKIAESQMASQYSVCTKVFGYICQKKSLESA